MGYRPAAMSFLDHFSDEHREQFEAAATVLELQRGKYLVRRGEPGGDVFLLRDGQLEVVDTRQTPEVILAMLKPGAVVGELAFVDDSPRSADVRAATDCEVLVWPREDLRRVLERHDALAATFYRNVAGVAAKRMRRVTTTAMAGGLGGRKAVNKAGLARVTEEARRVAEGVKEGLVDAETRLRQDATDKMSLQAVRSILDMLQQETRTLFVAHPEVEAADEAARVLGRELNPYLVRSGLAERCIRRPQGRSGTEEIMAHVLVNAAGGDGQLGEILDRWLLERPTLVALRAFRDAVVEHVAKGLPTHRNRRVLVVNAGTGSMIAGLVRALSDKPTALTVLDQSRDALAFLDAGMNSSNVKLATLQENMVKWGLGRSRRELPEQDTVVIHGLLEYLPDRLVVSMLSTAAAHLSENGVVIAAALDHSDDAELLDRVLRWPTVRRSPEHFRRLFDGAGLQMAWEAELEPPALLFGATS